MVFKEMLNREKPFVSAFMQRQCKVEAGTLSLYAVDPHAAAFIFYNFGGDI